MPTKKVAKKAPTKKASAKDYGTRADKGGAIEPYLAKLSGPVRDIADALVGLVRETVPASTAEIKWGMPVFSHHGVLGYLRATPKYVRFGFYETEGLDDPKGVLQGSGKGGHVRIEKMADLDRKQIASWLRQLAKRKST